jgi:AraC-like DNA-binding protein
MEKSNKVGFPPIVRLSVINPCMDELQRRGCNARQLLVAMASDHSANSPDSIAAIGRRVGYPDATGFARAFSNWTGQSHPEYRRTHKMPNQVNTTDS